MMTSISLRYRCSRTRGFTLLELLISVGIMLLLTVITIVSVNFTLSADRINGGARQVQSFLAGARDRAIYSKTPRGVRLLLDPNNGHLAIGMIAIGSTELFDEGTVTGSAADPTGLTVLLSDTAWTTLVGQGLIGLGARIQIPKDTGAWYRFASVPRTASGQSFVLLDRPCRALAGNSTSRFEYALELLPGVLPGEQPVLLPAGVVIDLDGSDIPANWRPSNFNGSYSGQMDLVFSPRGFLTGEAAAQGMIHLLLADQADVEKNWTQIAGRSSASYTVQSNGPIVPANNPADETLVVERDQLIVTIASRTGRITTHQVDVTNTVVPAGKIADDPFRFAETGKVARQ